MSRKHTKERKKAQAKEAMLAALLNKGGGGGNQLSMPQPGEGSHEMPGSYGQGFVNPHGVPPEAMMGE